MHDTYDFPLADFEVNPAYEMATALRSRPDAESVLRAADLLASARRPIILAGGGVHLSRAAETLSAFARSTNVPVGPYTYIHSPAKAPSRLSIR